MNGLLRYLKTDHGRTTDQRTDGQGLLLRTPLGRTRGPKVRTGALYLCHITCISSSPTVKKMKNACLIFSKQGDPNFVFKTKRKNTLKVCCILPFTAKHRVSQVCIYAFFVCNFWLAYSKWLKQEWNEITEKIYHQISNGFYSKALLWVSLTEIKWSHYSIQNLQSIQSIEWTPLS